MSRGLTVVPRDVVRSLWASGGGPRRRAWVVRPQRTFTVNMNQTSLLRDVVGFIVGGLSAAVAAGVSLVSVFPLQPDEPGRPNYGPAALAMLAIVTFICGGFIGRRTFSADFWSDLLLPVIISYLVMGFLCLSAGLDFREASAMIGFASVGIVVSIALLLFLSRRFPPKPQTYEG